MVGRTPEYVGKKGGVNAYPWPAFCRPSGRNRRNRGRAYLPPSDCLGADRGAPQALSFSLGVAPWHVARNPFFYPKLLKEAIFFALIKLDPRVQLKNPVMFVVYVGSLATTLLWAQVL
jgi:hypothetical protein